MSWSGRHQKNITALFLLLVISFSGGCGFEECKTNKRFADKPGICGKIYRTEQSKKAFNEKLIPAIYWIFGIMFSPIILLITFRTIRALLQAFVNAVSKLLQILRL